MTTLPRGGGAAGSKAGKPRPPKNAGEGAGQPAQTAGAPRPKPKQPNVKGPKNQHERTPVKQSHGQHLPQQTPITSSTTTTTDRFAWSSYQSAPDPADVPKPSLRMLANAREARCSWVPTTLPAVQVPEQAPVPPQEEHDAMEMTANLMKMLGIQQQPPTQ